jgi:hypothetical protein
MDPTDFAGSSSSSASAAAAANTIINFGSGASVHGGTTSLDPEARSDARATKLDSPVSEPFSLGSKTSVSQLTPLLIAGAALVLVAIIVLTQKNN